LLNALPDFFQFDCHPFLLASLFLLRMPIFSFFVIS